MKRTALAGIALIGICLQACHTGPGGADAGAPVAATRTEAVTLYRDRYGTPHVFAESNRGVYFGYGYAVAQDRLFQMEMLKRTATGTVSAVLGEDYLDLDITLRTQYNHPAVAAQVAALNARDREILAAYAEGFNARIDELATDRGALLPKPFIDYDFAPSRWSAQDVAAIFVGAIAHRYADFNSERDNLAFLQAMEARHGKRAAWALFNSVKWLYDNTSPTTIARTGEVDDNAPPRPAYLDELAPSKGPSRMVFDDTGKLAGLSSTPELASQLRQQLTRSGFGAHPEFAPASNFWAMNTLGDARGALLNGPQFGFSMPGYVYGIGLHGGDFDVVGNTLLALPSLLFAHNNAIAWGSTAGLSDQTDEYLLRLNPDNPGQYRHNGNWVDFDTWEETIHVRGRPPVTVTARRAVQGMVLDHRPMEGIAWARARAWEGKAVDSLMAWIWLAVDKALPAAVDRIGAKVTNINMYLMDKTGRLAYIHSGRYPQRAAGHDSRLPAVGDGRADWAGLRPYADNPKTLDPHQGYIVNWNNRPAQNWRSSDLWNLTWARADRAQVLIDAMRAARGGTVQQMVDINRRSTFADVNLPFLLPYLENALADRELQATRMQALALLRNWDGQWRADGKGQFGPAATLMEAWVRALLEQVFQDDVGGDFWHLFAATNYPTTRQGPSIGNPVGVKALVRQLDTLAAGGQPAYDFLNGQSPDTVLAHSFITAVDALRASQGEEVGAWRVDAAPMQWAPVNFRGVPQASEDNLLSVPTYQNRGSENNVFVATGTGIEGRDVIPPGQGGHLLPDGSPAPHYDDQLELYKRFEYKALPFSRAAVERAAASVTELRLPR
ncbi:penicillin acylase family protein [Parahaliea mediterranea]|uniref:Penicillin acylase family protein n=1 Tax=Parahaliea mediterranea TaxID=651086 RepID=A0A939IJ81_9GAMM|nr:penicillin acylase family protein [Parahaliea mediterranea]MBN7797369.1 penicillin acylase family protein [Parahaliea mediterranea]